MRFGDLKGGERIITPSGEVGIVSKAYEKHIPEKMYRLEDENGNTVEASGNHLWYVVTDFNRELHRERLKEGRKLGKSLSEDTISALESIALDERLFEMSIVDILELIGVAGDDSGPFHDAVVRTAESIGHIAEENITYEEDFQSSDTSETIRSYDANRFAKQLLSLFHVKDYRKKWPVLVGEVMTTEEIANLDCGVWIPEIENSGGEIS